MYLEKGTVVRTTSDHPTFNNLIGVVIRTIPMQPAWPTRYIVRVGTEKISYLRSELTIIDSKLGKVIYGD